MLQSYQNISLSTPNATIRLGPNDIQLTASRLDFEMSSAGNEKQTLLSVTEEELPVQATLVRAGGVQGVSFEGSVETGEIRASGDDKLRVEAPRGSLHLSGDTGVLLRAETGPVDVVASDRLVLSSAGTVSTTAGV